MTSIINPETFEAAEVQEGYYLEGTVEVTLRGETRRVKALMQKGGVQITAYGMTGRYQTGTRAWPANVTRVIDPTTGRAWDRIEFGRDERSGRCKKTSSIFFA